MADISIISSHHHSKEGVIPQYLRFYLFIYGSAGSLLLRGLFSSCGEQGVLFTAVHGLLTVVASLFVEQGL